MLNDLRFALRMLLKSPGFTAVAVVTLALGIGVNTAIYSLVNALFLSPPAGAAAPDQLVGIYELEFRKGKPDRQDIRYPDYCYYRDHNTVLSGLASHFGAHLADGERAEEIQASVVSENYFSVLGVKPHLGRFFLIAEEVVPGGNPVVVLSYSFWRTRFRVDAPCVGQTLKLNGAVFTIVGVAPSGFHGAMVGQADDVWIPNMMAQIAYPDLDILSRDSAELDLIGRLKPGRTVEQARSEFSVLAHQLEETYPETNRNTGVFLCPLKGVHPAVRSETSELPLILAATVTCLLLIACANLAGLLLARGASRHKEIGIRLALGAGRGRLIRQLLSESLLLSLLGGVTGLMITSWANDLLARYYTAEVEGVRPFYVLSLDWSVFLYSLLLTVVTGLAFGLAPALQASRPALVPILKEDASAFSYRRSRLRSAFLVSQVALSVVLLIGAGLIIQSLQRLKWRPGFDAQKVVFIRMKPHLSGYNQEKSIAYFREVQRRLESLSGVQSVTFAGYPPLRDWGAELRVSLPGHQPSRAEDILRVKQNGVTHEFFEALKIPLLRGRTFDAHDLQQGQQSVIVNETLAQHLWPNQEAVGQTIVVEGKPHEVIGVTKYENFRRDGEAPQPFLFRAEFGGNRMMARLNGDPRTMLPLLRHEILAVDPNVAISEELPLTEIVQNYFAPVKLAMGVLSYAGGLALLLSAIGLYGVLALTVGQRTREIGIRMALGARPGEVLELILREGMGLALLGLILGVFSALGLTRFLSSYLYGIARNDLATFVTVAFLLTGVAMLACYIPARRATKVDPMVALRYE